MLGFESTVDPIQDLKPPGMLALILMHDFVKGKISNILMYQIRFLNDFSFSRHL